MCKEFHNKIIFPTRYTKKRRDYQGAIVIDPTEPGLNENVTVMDYTSLYPTTVMAFNISPETFICSQEQCEKAGMDIEEVVQQLKDDNIDYVDTGYSKDLLVEDICFMVIPIKLEYYLRYLKRYLYKELKSTEH